MLPLGRRSFVSRGHKPFLQKQVFSVHPPSIPPGVASQMGQNEVSEDLTLPSRLHTVTHSKNCVRFSQQASRESNPALFPLSLPTFGRLPLTGQAYPLDT